MQFTFNLEGSRRVSREAMLNRDRVEGKWKQYKGQAKEKWGKLTDDGLDVIDGKRQQIVGKIQERHGISKEAVARQADEFVKSMRESMNEQDQRSRRAGRP